MMTNNNNPESLNYRLLELLSTGVLKQLLGKGKYSKEDAIGRIAETKSSKVIHNFFLDNMSVCKQHVFLFKLSSIIKPVNPQLIPSSSREFKCIRVDSNQNQIDEYYFTTVTQSFVSLSQRQILDLDFYLPIRVVVVGDILQIHFVVLERGTLSLKGQDISFRKKMISEDILAHKIVDIIKSKTGLQIVPLDINKGVKEIWHRDIIDTPRLQTKKTKSTSQETMDVGLYLKKEYPDVYKESIKIPLLSTLFHVIQHNSDYGEKFTCDPSFGRFSFTTYSDKNSINNVINIILQYN